MSFGNGVVLGAGVVGALFAGSPGVAEGADDPEGRAARTLAGEGVGFTS